MTRIVYLSYPTGAISGGQKVILRHVEALNRLGFDAVWWRPADAVVPPWLEFDAPQEVGTRFRPDDLLVVPSDAQVAIRGLARRGCRGVIFEQNQFSFISVALEQMAHFPEGKLPPFFAVGEVNANTIRRIYPEAQIEIVPCFADERTFKPVAEVENRIAYVPRKRPSEARLVQNFFQYAHPRHKDLPWLPIERADENVVAGTLARSSLFLSLPRFESVGMTTLEAMACGSVCAGFTGIGGRQFATAENGFWVPEDDCEAAGDALAEAADVVATGGARLANLREAGWATAEQWSYARFLVALEEVWERLAPEARTRSTARLADA